MSFTTMNSLRRFGLAATTKASFTKTTATRMQSSSMSSPSLSSLTQAMRPKTLIVRRPLHSLHTKRTNTLNNWNRRHFSDSSAEALTKETVKEKTTGETDFALFTQVGRIIYAFGLVYFISEYGFELTICEGPSMLPTIRPLGEIVLLDRFTPRWYGLQGGSNGKQRETFARKRQREHEQRIREEGKIDGRFPWHETRVPANQLSSTGVKDRFVNQVTSGISVGDVIVVKHPDRVGTVCKRVLGLPGDIVTKPTQRTQKEGILDRSMPENLVVPDGHLWIEGDNPWNSSDSRNYGPIPASLIVGRVLVRLWPLRGKAMMERGARPVQDDDPKFSFSGSAVFPAGYDNQIILGGKQHKEQTQENR
mmetsp:Transcript_22078/g.54551  ORF Transcript_22078/g.54551 Transcript_22078/m.54551 type:complete len:364 (-) Transcript_22078:2306-3397(-)